METTKFISKEMATMAAQAAFFYLFLNHKHVTVSASDVSHLIEVTVYPEDEEEVKLPEGYKTSGEREEWIPTRYQDEPPFKVKRFFFYF